MKINIERTDDTFTHHDLSIGGWYVDEYGNIIYSSEGTGMVVVFTRTGSSPYITERSKFKDTKFTRCSDANVTIRWR